ncbi:MAG: hypothetical protein KF781_06540 [Chitinophagaceae bacterium]|nr:hypothetical protein [Chitinophagaceae bacterium]MCW5904121.1 hypothetical protein [Chitinophagaceae bacterium]
MEPDIIIFFKRIIKGAFTVFVWMTINVTAGIKFGYAFWDKSFTIANLLFYIWFLISCIILFLILKRLWQKPISAKKMQQ